jgi:hypothetical protein
MRFIKTILPLIVFVVGVTGVYSQAIIQSEDRRLLRWPDIFKENDARVIRNFILFEINQVD